MHEAWRSLAAYIASIALVTAILVGCDSSRSSSPSVVTSSPPIVAGFKLTSSAFTAGQSIPKLYTCTGQNTSPPLQWTDPPAGTKSLALIVDDPDAPSGTYVHWVLYMLPPSARSLPEGVPQNVALPGGGTQGRNSSGNRGYNGPCPPSGTHRYFFKLYALDAELALPIGSDKAQMEQAMSNHILAYAELIGTFSK